MCVDGWEATQEASCSTTGCAASTTFSLPAATTTFQSLTLTASMRGDFGLSSETAEVLVDGVVVGTCFETGGADCTVDMVECLVQDVLSESLVDGDSTVSIGFEASSDVNHCTPHVHAEFTLRVGCHSSPPPPPPPPSPPPSSPPPRPLPQPPLPPNLPPWWIKPIQSDTQVGGGSDGLPWLIIGGVAAAALSLLCCALCIVVYQRRGLRLSEQRSQSRKQAAKAERGRGRRMPAKGVPSVAGALSTAVAVTPPPRPRQFLENDDGEDWAGAAPGAPFCLPPALAAAGWSEPPRKASDAAFLSLAECSHRSFAGDWATRRHSPQHSPHDPRGQSSGNSACGYPSPDSAGGRPSPGVLKLTSASLARGSEAESEDGESRRSRPSFQYSSRASSEESFREAVGSFSNFELIPWEAISLGELIGSGGAGDVYHAVYASTGVACKRLRFSREAANRAMQVLVEECRLALKLRHPNVLLTLGLVSDGDRNHGILTELMDLALDDFISQANGATGVPASWTAPYLSVATDVARGMAYLHSHRVIHRDLKPGNVLLKLPAMSAKVSDFGTSRLHTPSPLRPRRLIGGASAGGFSSAAMTMSMQGTPVYMAPEVLRQDRYGKPCDVWSFGGLLVHIATRRPPFAALLENGRCTPLDLLNKVTKGEMRPTSNPGGLPGVLCFSQAEWPQAVAQLAEACDSLCLHGFPRLPPKRPCPFTAARCLRTRRASPSTRSSGPRSRRRRTCSSRRGSRRPSRARST